MKPRHGWFHPPFLCSSQPFFCLPFLILRHSVFVVSKLMRSVLTPNSRCCERMTICLWWKVMIGRPLQCDMCCHFRVSWNSRTVFNLFLPEVRWQKYEKRKVVFRRSDTKVSGAMTWLAASADTPSTISSDEAWDALFVQRSTDSMSDSKAWMNYATVYFHSLVKFWDKQAPWYWWHHRAGRHLKIMSFSPVFLFYRFLSSFSHWTLRANALTTLWWRPSTST